MFGPQDVLVLGILALVFGGAKKIPEMMGGIGKGIREFKKALDDSGEEGQIRPNSTASAVPASGEPWGSSQRPAEATQGERRE